MNSLTELKKIIQSMNEAVTDIDLDAFQTELSQLGRQNEDNPVVISFLKMMRPLGNYIGIKKDTAHADSIPVLNAIAGSLDTIINDTDMDSETADQMLSQDIKKYKSLQSKIASRPEINETDLNDLKAVILAIDWEISDTTVQNFETVLTNLLSKLKPYKIHYTFLKIIHSTGRFIGIQKANAPADSISFLRSVFENFDRIVQTPDMTFKEKKGILETDINRFHEFKQTILNKKSVVASNQEVSEEDFVQPALSHVKDSGKPALDEIVPLTTLPDQEKGPLTTGETIPDSIKPALASKKVSPPGPRDVMDDLFSLKESPADELLDAIHLMDVHGPNQGQSMNMADQANDLQSAGIKNFTPREKDNAPIPEIGNRLDEFFSLDIEDEPAATEEIRPEPEIETIAMVEDESAESIVPFQYEDESVEESRHSMPDDEPSIQLSDSDLLKRLRSEIETGDWQNQDASLMLIHKDISSLENYWENDPDKKSLLQIIALSINQLTKNSEITSLKQDDRTGQIDSRVSGASQEKPAGLLGKIKGMFSS